MSTPRSSSAWRMVRPSSTSYVCPSTVSLAISELETSRERTLAMLDVGLELRPEVSQQALNRPRGGVRKGTDRLALHHAGQAREQIDVAGATAPVLDALTDLVRPACSLSTL